MPKKPTEIFGIRLGADVDETRMQPGRIPAAPNYDVGFRWIDLEPEERPNSPVEEYYSSDVCYDEPELMDRWAGINGSRQVIRKLFKEPFLSRMAKRAEFRIAMSDVDLDVTDPEYDRRTMNKMATLFDEMIFNEMALTGQGKEPHMRRVVDDNGLHYEEGWRAQTAADRVKHYQAVTMLFNLRQLAAGKATAIVENRGGKKSEIDDLRGEVEKIMRERMQVELQSSEVVDSLPAATEEIVDKAFEAIAEGAENEGKPGLRNERSDSVAFKGEARQ